MFQAVSNQFNAQEIENKVLEFWEKERIFQKSIEQRADAKTFFFYDGPPFATGLPHYGHLLAGTIKDVIPRYQTMKGHKVERRFGWDCHGLPVEFEVEKELGLKGKIDIDEMGIDKFNEYCRSIVLRYREEWRTVVKKMGRWVDIDNDYKTMDLSFMESIWWVVKRLWEKELLYQSWKVVPYSVRLNTPLSNFEANLNYMEVQDPSVVAKFKVLGEENTYFIAWTTTPWTLPSNLAITAHPTLEYVLVEYQNERYYLAKQAVERTFENKDEVTILQSFLGKELEKKRYEPLFPYFKEHEENAFFITLGDYVTSETGTGLVHTAPSFGEDDFNTGKKYNLPFVLPINESGAFKAEVSDFQDVYFKDADKAIIKHLKAENKVFSQSTIQHQYPFCWRTDTPLMYRIIPSWYVNVQQIKEKMVQNNKTVHYVPQHIRDGRMGKWLEGARDWSISRNRYWGTPIPIWICEECDHRVCIGSVEELEEKTKKKIDDLHRHFIDHLQFECEKCSSMMKRTEEVLDCWFESGSMPYAQEHYPFENKEKFENAFPADFISEGLDQTRGWFYTLTVLSNALFDKPAYKNNIVSGMILAEDGKKMAKSKKNYPDPMLMIDSYGADTIRLYMLNSNAIKAEELKFSEAGLKETMRNIILPLWNVLSFFTTYAALDQWTYDPKKSTKSNNKLDRWIISYLNRLIEDVTKAMDSYDLIKAVSPFVSFIDKLTNWYIRRSRRRFWKSEQAEDKESAYETLYFVLMNLSKIIAPFIPFIAEEIYKHLKSFDDPQSVHLNDFPRADQASIDHVLEMDMDLVLRSVELARALRAKANIKIRQPIQTMTIITRNNQTLRNNEELKNLIQEEINVKTIELSNEEAHLVEYFSRPNLPVLGPKYGKMIKQIKEAVASFKSDEIATLIKDKKAIERTIEGEIIRFNESDLLIERKAKDDIVVENDDFITIALDTHLSAGLIEEGIVREIINKIQQLRKQEHFEIADRIDLTICAPDEITKAINNHKDYIKQETLALNLEFTENTALAHQLMINEHKVECNITQH